ncbi:hypothetical protein [Aeoliella mucimassa]|uniref:PEP-CTERM protein-sorting domain-containing protein n=1 Tax=Aeoliella mucimassa TaxID=2527972 RepID=A0A518ASE6_9BACT|nr:hypothetical protein [Aeoliella mucimassa]QDU57642.1 hypothetical protein Pan181_38610 [Aeoliella mucimassa]
MEYFNRTRWWQAVFIGMLVAGLPASVQALGITPDAEDWPFGNWSRSDANSSYAAWDMFTSAEGGDNLPDVGQHNAAEANVVETSDPAVAFLTSSGNIYSFSAATDFDVTMPAIDLGAGASTSVVLQVVTQGSELDYSSVRLSYDDGDQGITPDSTAELGRIELGGFGGELVTTLFAWDLDGVSTSSFLLEFNASAESMSLDEVILDTLAMASEVISQPGDYDGSGVVDHGDYEYWISQFGATNSPADGNGDGIVDLGDYTLWRDNLGSSTLTSGVASSQSVPEPATAGSLLVIIGLAGGSMYLASKGNGNA